MLREPTLAYHTCTEVAASAHEAAKAIYGDADDDNCQRERESKVHLHHSIEYGPFIR